MRYAYIDRQLNTTENTVVLKYHMKGFRGSNDLNPRSSEILLCCSIVNVPIETTKQNKLLHNVSKMKALKNKDNKNQHK